MSAPILTLCSELENALAGVRAAHNMADAAYERLRWAYDTGRPTAKYDAAYDAARADEIRAAQRVHVARVALEQE